MTRKGKVNPSGAYQGPKYWEYDGMCLSDIKTGEEYGKSRNADTGAGKRDR